jgi:hypothetical protein
MSSNNAIPRDRVMPLEGAEALSLHQEIIGRNIGAMKEQANLLRTELATRRALLNEFSEANGARIGTSGPRQVDLVSRVTPVQPAMRNSTRDEGRPFEVGNQVLISSQFFARVQALPGNPYDGHATREAP